MSSWEEEQEGEMSLAWDVLGLGSLEHSVVAVWLSGYMSLQSGTFWVRVRNLRVVDN